MGQDELIASLRREAGERIVSLWEEARVRAGAIRKEKEDKLSRMREEMATSRQGAADEEAQTLLRQADAEIRAWKLRSEEEISTRLHHTAVNLLKSLRDDKYEETFRSLAAELPSFQWTTVRVRPTDVDLARSLFPDADIIGEERILGGLEAGNDRDRVRVVNTFGKRLERAWEELLPLLLNDVEASF